MGASETRTRTGPPGGFTLVELLTVIIIIGLLASILLPTVTSALKSGYGAKTFAQRKNLEDGAENYKQDHRGLYPGQDDISILGSGAGKFTGSQVLAAYLFDYQLGAANPEPTGKYAAFKEEYLTTLEARPLTLSDLFPKGREMAFCYYAARRTSNLSAMYVYEDNSVYTNSAGAAAGDFSTFIADQRFNNEPRQKGRFILIAPGGDRKYFTPDDVKNW